MLTPNEIRTPESEDGPVWREPSFENCVPRKAGIVWAWIRSGGWSLAIHLLIGIPVAMVLWFQSLAGQGHFGAPEPAIDSRILPEPNALVVEDVAHTDMVKPVPVDPEIGETVPSLTLKAMIERQLERAQLPARDQNVETREGDLQEMAERLESISSAENVGRMAEKIGAAMGFTPRLERSSEDPEATFHDDRAQIEDVRKEQSDDGETIYIATLMDDQGLLKEVELEEQDGAELHRVFQLMKDFPLLKKVYKSIVVNLIDQALQQKETSIRAPSVFDSARESPPIE
ncbi:MAG: YrdB family protein [Planctomycetaceae bacterium]|nr:YrdB family protein [Planctomycetaceae bacterium]